MEAGTVKNLKILKILNILKDSELFQDSEAVCKFKRFWTSSKDSKAVWGF